MMFLNVDLKIFVPTACMIGPYYILKDRSNFVSKRQSFSQLVHMKVVWSKFRTHAIILSYKKISHLEMIKIFLIKEFS